jgi:hypothetical protein
MSPRVISAQCQDDYRVTVTFSNNEQRIIDISPYLSFGVFGKLKDINLFQQVRVAFGTIEWPGGVDLDPEFVWQKSIPLNQQ